MDRADRQHRLDPARRRRRQRPSPARSPTTTRPAPRRSTPIAAARASARPTRATVKSGNAGVTDVAGNRLAADETWTFSTPAAVPVHDLRRRRRPRAGDRHPRPAARGRRALQGRRGRLHHRAALLQAVQQHRHPRRPPVGGRRPAAGDRRRSRTRPPRAGRTSTCRTRSRSPRTRSTSSSYYSPGGFFPFDQGYFAAPQRRRPADRARRRPTAATASTATAPAAFPTETLQRDQLLGRRDLRAHGPAGHARARRSPTRRRPPAPSTSTRDADVTRDVRRAARRRPRVTARDVHAARTPAAQRVPGDRRPTTPQTRTAEAQPDAPLAYSTQLHGDAQGRRGRRQGRRRQPARGRQDLDVHDRRPAARPRARAARSSLVTDPGRPVRHLLRRDPARRGPERVRDRPTARSRPPS